MEKIITICGSMRFQAQMMAAARRLELAEHCIVIQCVYFDEGCAPTAGEREVLSQLHRRKIELSDAIYVVNVGGYMGSSTQQEIHYARSLNKEILFLVPPEQRPSGESIA